MQLRPRLFIIKRYLVLHFDVVDIFFIFNVEKLKLTEKQIYWRQKIKFPAGAETNNDIHIHAGFKKKIYRVSLTIHLLEPKTRPFRKIIYTSTILFYWNHTSEKTLMYLGYINQKEKKQLKSRYCHIYTSIDRNIIIYQDDRILFYLMVKSTLRLLFF
jgi:hypothetical protein